MEGRKTSSLERRGDDGRSSVQSAGGAERARSLRGGWGASGRKRVPPRGGVGGGGYPQGEFSVRSAAEEAEAYDAGGEEDAAARRPRRSGSGRRSAGGGSASEGAGSRRGLAGGGGGSGRSRHTATPPDAAGLSSRALAAAAEEASPERCATARSEPPTVATTTAAPSTPPAALAAAAAASSGAETRAESSAAPRSSAVSVGSGGDEGEEVDTLMSGRDNAAAEQLLGRVHPLLQQPPGLVMSTDEFQRTEQDGGGV